MLTSYQTRVNNILYRSSLQAVVIALLTGGISAKILGLTFTMERLIALPVGFGLVAFALVRRRLQVTRPALILTAWLYWALFVSCISDFPGPTFKGWLILLLAIVFYALAIQAKAQTILELKRVVIPIFIVLSIAAVTVFVLYSLSGSGYLELFHENGDQTRVRMSMAEPNLFGTVMIFGCLLSIATFDRSHLMSWIFLVTAHLSLLLAFSRAPFAGYLIGLGVYFYLQGRLSLPKILRFIFLLTCTVLLLWFSNFPSDLSSAPIQMFNRTSSINSRYVMMALAWDDIVAHPVTGTGVFSFGALHPGSIDLVGSESESSAWIGTMLYAVLHDTGIIGLTLFLWLFASLFYRSWTTLKNVALLISDRDRRSFAALFGSFVGFFVAGQATSAYSLGFFWVVAGLVDACACQCLFLAYKADIPYEREGGVNSLSGMGEEGVGK